MALPYGQRLRNAVHGQRGPGDLGGANTHTAGVQHGIAAAVNDHSAR